MNKYIAALVSLLVVLMSPMVMMAGNQCLVEGPYDLRVRSAPILDESTIQRNDGQAVLLSFAKVAVGKTIDLEGNLWIQIENGWVAGWVANQTGDCSGLSTTYTYVVEKPVETVTVSTHAPPAPPVVDPGDGEGDNPPKDDVFSAERALAMYSIDPSVVLDSCGTNCWSPPSGTVLSNPHGCWVPGYLMVGDGVENPNAPGDDKVGIPPNSGPVAVEAATLYPGC